MNEQVQRHCFAVLVANEPGVLARVVGMFSGRGYNIESLTVDEVDAEAQLSRITIVTRGTRTIVDQIGAQLGRLIPVRSVVNLTERGRYVESCTAFIKLVGNESALADAKLISRRYGALIADTSENAIIFEVTSEREKTEQMIAQLRPLGAVEVARTGSLAMGCGDAMLGDAKPQATRQSA